MHLKHNRCKSKNIVTRRFFGARSLYFVVSVSCVAGFQHACTPRMNSVATSEAAKLDSCSTASRQKIKSLNIIGGEEVQIDSLDHPLAPVVEIRAKFTDDKGTVNGMGFCTGSLIGRDLVLTAAHCVSKPRSMSEITVNIAPRKNESGQNVSTLFSSKAAMFVSHSGYDPQEPGSKMPEGFVGQNDIAIVRLAEPAPDKVPLIAVGDMKFDSKFSGNFVISGHGVSSESDSNSRAHRKKEHVFSVVPGYSDNWFDLEAKEKVQMCVGDSGGPLLGSKGGKFYLVGVFESAPACSQEKESSVYISRMTRAGAYFDWIASQASFDSKDVVSLCRTKVYAGKNGMILNSPGVATTVDEVMAATPIADGSAVELLGVRWYQKKHYGLVNHSGLVGYVPIENLADSSDCKVFPKSEVVIKHEIVSPPTFLSASQDLDVSGCATSSGP